MPVLEPKPPLDFPADPLKWDGWEKYRADNPYERLCLDARSKPGPEQIQQHCNALLQWWRKKLPLKNQPSNPMAQLLGRGIDEAPRCLVQARVQLLDIEQRRQIDEDLAAQAERDALAEFVKYVAFAVARKVLTPQAEADLSEFGQRNGLTPEQTRICIEEELQRSKAKRANPAPAQPAEAPRDMSAAPDAEKEFFRILRLSDLDLSDASKQVRRIFGTIAENLGIDGERAEHLLDEYFDLAECRPSGAPAPSRDPRLHPSRVAAKIPAAPVKAAPPPPPVQPVVAKAPASPLPAQFISPVGEPMILIPAGEFVMGSDAVDAAPDEQPLTPVTLSDFYMARHPVTNAQYEQFDPTHRQKRMNGAGDNHPVVHVSSQDAAKYCQWLRQRDGRNYRLPTEAEWEYAARGTDGRKYPWGNYDRLSDLANFADASTGFPWRDPHINDRHPETSPVGAFPRGASPFGLEDMAGNVWEWCVDFYQALPGAPKRNPRGLATGSRRVYRGGSWKSRFTNLRATARSSNAANYSCNDVGFRVACECGAGELKD